LGFGNKDPVVENKRDIEAMVQRLHEITPCSYRKAIGTLHQEFGHTTRYCREEVVDSLIDTEKIENRNGIIQFVDQNNGEKPKDTAGNHYDSEAEAQKANEKISAKEVLKREKDSTYDGRMKNKV
jgi:hypothetical protein